MMSRLRYKLERFMQGRYGADELYKACIVIYLILLVLGIFIYSLILSFFTLFTLAFIFFRFFSKNIVARRRENEIYLSAKRGIRNYFTVLKKRFTDKEHVYRKCPKCKSTLRFPKKKGEHDAVCPKCNNNLKVKIR